MRKPIITSTTSLTLRDTMQRLQLFTWTGTKIHMAFCSFYFSETRKPCHSLSQGQIMITCCMAMNSFPSTKLITSLCLSFVLFLYFCLCRILGYRRIPPAVGRLVDVVKEIKNVTTDRKLARTFFTSPGTDHTFTHYLFRLFERILIAVVGLPVFPLLSLAPPSGQCVFLRPVLLLLLNRTCCVWTPHWAGGLSGRYAAGFVLGETQVLEVPLETLLQPQQAGKVSGAIDLRAIHKKGRFLHQNQDICSPEFIH